MRGNARGQDSESNRRIVRTGAASRLILDCLRFRQQLSKAGLFHRAPASFLSGTSSPTSQVVRLYPPNLVCGEYAKPMGCVCWQSARSHPVARLKVIRIFINA